MFAVSVVNTAEPNPVQNFNGVSMPCIGIQRLTYMYKLSYAIPENEHFKVINETKNESTCIGILRTTSIPTVSHLRFSTGHQGQLF